MVKYKQSIFLMNQGKILTVLITLEIHAFDYRKLKAGV